MSKYKLLILSILSLLFFCINGFEAVTAPATTTTEISLESQAQFYHSQDRKQLGDAIKKSIHQARESILIFTFSLSDPEVITALNQRSESRRESHYCDRQRASRGNPK